MSAIYIAQLQPNESLLTPAVAKKIRAQLHSKISISDLLNDHNGWFSAEQIGIALEYPSPKADIEQLFQEFQDEFDSQTTALIEQSDQKVRVFNRRGIHLIGMFAEAPKAKEFRSKVLDDIEQFLATT